jgi:hypothetical protein
MWQPIETAPKDRHIIVWPPTYTGGCSCAKWDDDRYAKRPRPYWRRIDASFVSDSRGNPPTHWDDVPEGPEGVTCAATLPCAPCAP